MLQKYSNKSGKRAQVICSYCSQPFETLAIKTKNKQNLFCCTTCYKNYRSKNKQPDSKLRRKHLLKHRYNLTTEKYTEMYTAQEGKCAICCEKPSENKLVVDHCHRTGKVRGLLCDKCNTGLGFFRDNADLLLSAIGYLKE